MKSFFNIRETEDGYEKIDDIGEIPFTTGTASQNEIYQKAKEDYHSDIEFQFILAPVSEEGGYAYMSPIPGIALNKNSKNADWALEFLNFFYTAENNELYAKESNIIPNTQDAIEHISDQYDIAQDHICELGQVTFDYGFYNAITQSLMEISKGNNPKYMRQDAEGNATLYDFTYYMENARNYIVEQRNGETTE